MTSRCPTIAQTYKHVCCDRSINLTPRHSNSTSTTAMDPSRALPPAYTSPSRRPVLDDDNISLNDLTLAGPSMRMIADDDHDISSLPLVLFSSFASSTPLSLYDTFSLHVELPDYCQSIHATPLTWTRLAHTLLTGQLHFLVYHSRPCSAHAHTLARPASLMPPRDCHHPPQTRRSTLHKLAMSPPQDRPRVSRPIMPDRPLRDRITSHPS